MVQPGRRPHGPPAARPSVDSQEAPHTLEAPSGAPFCRWRNRRPRGDLPVWRCVASGRGSGQGVAAPLTPQMPSVSVSVVWGEVLQPLPLILGFSQWFPVCKQLLAVPLVRKKQGQERPTSPSWGHHSHCSHRRTVVSGVTLGHLRTWRPWTKGI